MVTRAHVSPVFMYTTNTAVSLELVNVKKEEVSMVTSNICTPLYFTLSQPGPTSVNALKPTGLCM